MREWQLPEFGGTEVEGNIQEPTKIGHRIVLAFAETHTEESCVLVSGETVSADKKLIAALRKKVRVKCNSDHRNILTILAKTEIRIILLELSEAHSAAELESIRVIKTQFPSVEIVIINGDMQLIATAFNLGARDAFRRPYRRELIVERLVALLKL